MGDKQRLTVAGTVDQVARWNEFHERHPEVTMDWPRPGSAEKFRAWWRVNWGTFDVTGSDLSWVLNELDGLFGD